MAPRVLMAALLTLAALAFSPVLQAQACYVSNVGDLTCKNSSCYTLTGTYETMSAQFTLGTNGQRGGINYEFFTTLCPSTMFNSTTPNFQFIGQGPATDVHKCCNLCSQTANCQFFRFFPQGTTDNFQSITNPTKKYNFTYKIPFPPCPFANSAYCGSYNQNDASNPCLLFKLNSNNWYKKDGVTSCTKGTAGCFPGLTQSLTGPTYVTSTSDINSVSGTMTIPGHTYGKPRNYWGGSCNPFTNGSVSDDPHFVGGDGVRFDFNGEIGRSFCLITDDQLHINMVLGGYLDDRHFGASVLENGKAIRTWITALSIMWKDSQGIAHTLYIEARKGKEQDRGAGFIALAALDTMPVPVPKKVGDSIEGEGARFALQEQRKRGPYDLDVFSLEIAGVLQATISTRVAHPLLQTPGEAFAHFNVAVDDFRPSPRVHGVLGQTLRGGSGRLVKVLEYKVLTSLLRHPIQADGESGTGYLEGKTDDYRTSKIGAADCKFAVFSGST